MIGKPGELDGSTTRFCPGKSGLGVLISEDDLRETVSVGRNHQAAAREPAAQAWFGPFNSTTNTVEWRAVDGKPFAIIQRWLIADNGDRDKEDRPIAKPMLTVTKAAARRGLSRRLYRCTGQSKCQRPRAQGGG
jgi:hypothetical protein